MNTQKVLPVSLMIGVLYSDQILLQKAEKLLMQCYGDVDYQSQDFDFNISNYYIPEMGPWIQRRFLSFKRLISPETIATIKLETNEIENALALDGQRKVNLDPGYLDYDKLVLASAKYNAQKIHLSKGIWADLTLRYEKGAFYPFPWSFPDFKSGQYNTDFLEMRVRYKKKLKAQLPMSESAQ